MAALKDTVSDLFSGNPFATEVGHRIEQATDSKMGTENWALFMEICDLINENEESAKDAARAIKKRWHIVVPAKDFDSAQLVLTVLETCVKNCAKRFHSIVLSKDFVSELVKYIGPKYDPPVILQERVLGLIQNWAETFRHSGDIHGVVEVFEDLKSKGVEFPVLDLETMAPIITPQRSQPPASTVQPPPTARSTSTNAPSVVPYGPDAVPAHGPMQLTPEQLAKLRSEVDVVKSNIQVFSEMLNEMKPGQEEAEDLQLLMDLNATIRSMQDRIVQLLTIVTNEEVTEELLLVNDEMNSLFLRFERYERQRKGASAVQNRALPQPPQPQEGGSSLIDFSDSSLNQAQRQMGAMTISTQPVRENDSDSEEFGAFALSRSAGPPTSQPPAMPPPQIPKEEELREMENWLQSQSQGNAGQVERPPLSSAEFDRFLETRAVAAEQLPNVSTVAGTPSAVARQEQEKRETSHLLDS